MLFFILTQSYLLLQVSFLTFRPPTYIHVHYTSQPSVVDAGDDVEFNATIVNTGAGSDTHTAYDFNMRLEFKSLIMASVTLHCSKGSIHMNTPSAAMATVNIGDLAYGKEVYCNITGRVVASVPPEEDVSPVIGYTYFSTPGSRPAGSVSYNITVLAKTLVASINTNVTASQNAQTLLAGEDLSFTVRLRIPECVTQLAVMVTMPALSLAGTRFERKRRSVLRTSNMESSERFVFTTFHNMFPG